MGKLIGTKFLEERPGVLSMARLAAFLQTIAGFLVQLGSIIVAIKGNEHSAGIVAALSAGSAACFAGAWAAPPYRRPALSSLNPLGNDHRHHQTRFAEPEPSTRGLFH